MAFYVLTQEGALTPGTCSTSGYLSGDGKVLLSYTSTAGDGADSFVETLRCRSFPLRQKQRDDYFNAPRNAGPHNSPRSRQASLRSHPGGNTYLMERVLEGCGC